jgi:hypothetical protein
MLRLIFYPSFTIATGLLSARDRSGSPEGQIAALLGGCGATKEATQPHLQGASCTEDYKRKARLGGQIRLKKNCSGVEQFSVVV